MRSPPGHVQPEARTPLTSPRSSASRAAIVSGDGGRSWVEDGAIGTRFHAVGWRDGVAAPLTLSDVAEAGMVTRTAPLCGLTVIERLDQPATTYWIWIDRAVVRTCRRSRPSAST
jgi:hypothetical protein